jgi:hypothetical protein
MGRREKRMRCARRERRNRVPFPSRSIIYCEIARACTHVAEQRERKGGREIERKREGEREGERKHAQTHLHAHARTHAHAHA